MITSEEVEEMMAESEKKIQAKFAEQLERAAEDWKKTIEEEAKKIDWQALIEEARNTPEAKQRQAEIERLKMIDEIFSGKFRKAV